MNIRSGEIRPATTSKKETRIKQGIYQETHTSIQNIGLMAVLGHKGRARRATYDVFKTHNSKLFGLMKSGLYHLPLQVLNALAEEFDFDGAFNEPIQRYRKRKPQGGCREICVPGTYLMATHHLIGAVIDAQTVHSNNVYSRKGQGRNALIQDALRRVNDGHCYVSTLDIENCFASVNPVVLDRLPVHQRFVSHSLRNENLIFATPLIKYGKEVCNQSKDENIFSPLYREDMNNTGAPTGLMQGSPASWPILGWVWKDLPPIDENVGFVHVYVDDILVVAKSEAGRREITDAVVQFLQDCPAGPLGLTQIDYNVGQAFEFLGYEISYDCGDGLADARLAEAAFSKLERVLPQLVEVDRLRGSEFPYSACAKLRAILGGHSMASDLDEWWDYYVETLLDYDLTSESPFDLRYTATLAS
ncbi:hypothetical protein GS634_08125 [Ruegeria atlantica]|uniref:Reverse transcriptase domain-containing protein n=1 Tax=Ruegeria atlantica TaxID=81569 RepID=A0AA90ZFK4_9RHOB|nr:hypothetical protein [Ruegeria atlantica]NOE18089.1 hypothetical protein [Ruegeria atlantica]